MSIAALSSTDATSYWEEFFNVRNSSKNRKSEDLSTALFNDSDADGDGKVSMQESGLSRQAFDALDADQDGNVSQEELGEALQLLRSALFTRMKLGEEEQTEAAADAGGGQSDGGQSGGAAGQSVFDAMDTNQDGTVSAEELAAALQKQQDAADGNSNSASISGKAKDLLLSLANKAYSAIARNPSITEQINSTI
jgi:Ca2+-binding EF-hand superfamily protein